MLNHILKHLHLIILKLIDSKKLIINLLIMFKTIMFKKIFFNNKQKTEDNF
jgi:hypothetical protein